ncbi:RHS repeat-associated core domain-containing protein [Kutzneria sp. CA-103260]|uniref:RHS repeat-associated core domain-containing protein n=1 Tax=Kutzneria sp. CA-103260 TaxID=2802641 RepID=UPI001BA992C8|nr:RHS repeat-associated core domain-containing protein [Kutzneria sp. CA-103260]
MRAVRRPRSVLVASAAAVALVASLVNAGVTAPLAQADGTGQVSVEKPIPHADRALKGADKAAFESSTPLVNVSWPAAGDADVTTNGVSRTAKAATPARAGTLPISLSAENENQATETPSSTFHVHLADQAATRKAGISGLLFTVKPDKAQDQHDTVQVDYSSFRNAVGGDFGSRLHLSQLPACALTDPDRPDCRQQTPLASSSNDAKSARVSAQVSFAAQNAQTPMVLAATAGPSGPNGTFTASSLSPSGTWSVGGSTGAFTWSYPIAVPPSAAASTVAPTVSLSYNSSAVDGQTSGTNNQSSWIGEGWDYSPGYIERSYRSCDEDPAGTAPKVHDLCWAGQVVSMDLNNQSVSLVTGDNGQTWHASADTGDRIELVHGANGANNGVHDGEYWRVTTPDGTQYFFGRNSGPAGATNSAWTEPVYGAHAGDPCNNTSGFAASSCPQAWRWNLDYVEDPHGNVTAYYYTPETNYYGANGGKTGVLYTRDGYLARIDYGLRDVNGTVSSGPAPDQIVFTTAERCLPTATMDCAADKFTKDNAAFWPDTPQDQQCVKTDQNKTPTCDNPSPSLWTTKRLVKISTQYYNGSGYTPVDSYDLTHQFFTASDSDLWLSSIKHTGFGADGASLAMPPVSFVGQTYDNRVLGYNTQPAMAHRRMTAITAETGQVTKVTYTPAECTGTNYPQDVSNDQMMCFPVYWTPEFNSTPILDFFHKYATKEVDVQDTNALSPTKRTTYDYQGKPAWHFDDNELVKPVNRTYGQFRGFGEVDVRSGNTDNTSNGSADRQTLTKTTYYRGMDGDTMPNGKTRDNVKVPDSLGEQVSDSNQIAGTPREAQTYNGDGGGQISTVITDASVIATTGSRARTGLPALTADVVATTKSRTLTTLAAGGVRTDIETTAYDGAGRVSQQTSTVDGLPDLCTTTSYADNTDKWIRTRVKEVVVSQQQCPAPGTAPAPILSDTRNFYDGQSANGALPGPGDVTRTDSATTNTNGALTFATTMTATYDASGRVTSTTDARQGVTKTAYTPPDGGVLTKRVVTNPLQQATTYTYEPANGAPTEIVDVAGHVTDAQYDQLGRLTGVWLPGHHRGSDPASSTYAYALNSTGPSTVTTKTLIDYGSGTFYTTNVSLLDSFGQVLQTQSNAEGGGRIVSDNFYDSHGWVIRSNNRYYTDGDPGTTLVSVADKDVEDRTLNSYDGSGRILVAADYNGANPKWSTTTVYGGDRTTTIPPAGGVTTTQLVDGRGRTSEVRQYTAAPAVNGSVVSGGAYQTTSYHYTPLGLQDQITDADGDKWSYSYDLMGRKKSQTDVDAGTTSYSYDDAGLLTSETDARGQTLAFSYDPLARRTGEFQGSLTGPQLASWTYDTVQTGKLSYSTRYTADGDYLVGVTGYDAGGNPTGSILRVPDGEAGLAGDYTTSMSYTSTGLLDVTTPAPGGKLPGEQIVTAYDQLGNAKSVSGYNTYATNAEYTPYGELHKFSTAGGQGALAVERDAQTRRVTDVKLTATKAPVQIDDTSYTYDPAGNLTSSTDVEGPAGSPVQQQCFTYDALDRLAQAWTAANCGDQPSTAGISGANPYWTSWGFEPAGLRKTQVQHSLTAGVSDTTTTYNYPDPSAPQAHTLSSSTTSGPGGNSAASYTYDAVGNTKTRTLPSGQQTLTWNEDGRLSTDQTDSGTTSYVYDADGNILIRRDPGSSTLYLPGEELKYNTSLKTVVGTRYYAMTGGTVAMRVGGANPTVLTSDQHGTSSIAYQPDTGAVTRRAFDPYGNQFGTPQGIWPDDHGFLNKSVDQSTGLTDVGAREYDSTTGRFLSVDPQLDPSSPGQLNGYAYSADNPTTFSDPTGTRIAGCEEYHTNCIDGGPVGEQHGDGPPSPSPNPSPIVFNSPHVKASYDFATGHYYINHVLMPTDMNFDSALKLLKAMLADPAEKTWWPQRSSFEDPLAGDDDVVMMLQHVCHMDDCGKGVGKELFTMHMAFSLPILVAFGGLNAGSADLAGMEASRILPNGKMYEPGSLASKFTEMPDRVRKALSCATGNSFAAGTPVLMADGSVKPIEDVKVGDTVENADVDSGVRQQHVVTAVHVTDTDTDFVDLAIGPPGRQKTVTVTAHHLFWDATTHQWVDAADLRIGDQLDTPGDGHVAVVSSHRYTKSIRTYNLTVDVVHTYYVLAGNTPILVHNVGGMDGCSDPAYQGVLHITDEVAKGNTSHDLGMSEDELADYLDVYANSGTGQAIKGGGVGWYDSNRGVMIIQRNEYSMTAFKTSKDNFESRLDPNR